MVPKAVQEATAAGRGLLQYVIVITGAILDKDKAIEPRATEARIKHNHVSGRGPC